MSDTDQYYSESGQLLTPAEVALLPPAQQDEARRRGLAKHAKENAVPGEGVFLYQEADGREPAVPGLGVFLRQMVGEH